MNTDIENTLSKKLAAAVAKEIDIPKLAKKLAPRFEKNLTLALLKSAQKFEFGDAICDCLYDKEAAAALRMVMVRAFKKMK